MKETIKKSFVWWIVFLSTVIIWAIAYATVSTVTTWQTLTADMWNGMAWNYDYSLSEINTGKKWVDDKPIYRKVVNVQNIPITTTTYYPHNISDIDIVLDIEYTYDIGSTWHHISSFWYVWRRVWINDVNISVISNVDILNARFVIEYTKITP